MKWGSEPGLRKRATGSVKVLRLSLQGEGGERNEMDKAHSLEQTVHRPEEELSPLGLCRGATSPGGSGQVSREATSRVSRPGVKRTAVPPRRGGTCSLSHCSDHPSASPTLSLPLPVRPGSSQILTSLRVIPARRGELFSVLAFNYLLSASCRRAGSALGFHVSRPPGRG